MTSLETVKTAYTTFKTVLSSTAIDESYTTEMQNGALAALTPVGTVLGIMTGGKRRRRTKRKGRKAKKSRKH